MSLPFEKDNSRKFVCFVCANSFTNIEEYKNHIIEKHEEGRDYVKCPLERCGYPVRDLKMHHARFHKHEPLPKVGQLRAIIWKDISNGRAKNKKPKFHGGHIISMKNHGKEIQYRSRLECEFFECLEAIPEVLAYDYEPFKTGIPYMFEGTLHHYFPDLSIKFSDGHIEIWEIKPMEQTKLPVNQAKWLSATQYCSARNWEFIVMTEEVLVKLKRKVRDIKSRTISD